GRFVSNAAMVSSRGSAGPADPALEYRAGMPIKWAKQESIFAWVICSFCMALWARNLLEEMQESGWRCVAFEL
ncbi:MAG: hypothetical protein AAGA47_09930, partial [Pseudomonadota bacterium]